MTRIPIRTAVAVLVAASTLMLAAPPGKKRALVVGVNRYDGAALSHLEYAENDAVELAKMLRSPACGYDDVRLLTSKGSQKPTAANIRVALKSLLRGATREDTILVALAGHGVQVEATDKSGVGEPKKYSFFCPSDADLTTVVYKTGHSDTMINLDHLFEELGESNPGVKLVLVDACRNQLKVAGRTRSLAETRVLVPDGVQALFSCGRKQVAYESDEHKHGLFFFHVLEGLRGKAKNPDGEVTWASLTDHTTRAVTRGAKKLFDKVQTPAAIGSFEGETPVLARDDKVVTNGIGMKLVKIPAGEFWMGSPETDKDRGLDETHHQVTISKAFYMGVYEVTQGQFKEVMGFNPSFHSHDGVGRKGAKYHDGGKPGGGKGKLGAKAESSQWPVENVSWEEAKEFCDKLTAMPMERRAGRAYRLPTEAEWEYACRGGASAYQRFYTGDTLTKDDANFANDRTTRVGSYKPNRFGLFDMYGNVIEWVADGYDKTYYARSPKRDPLSLPSREIGCVRRGGCFYNGDVHCRSAFRNNHWPWEHFGDTGFRVVMVPSEK